MPEDPKKPFIEVWVTTSDGRHRVYRGKSEEHAAWKMAHHKRHEPELKKIPAAGGPEKPAAGDPKSPAW